MLGYRPASVDPVLVLRAVLETAATRGWRAELDCEGCFSVRRGPTSGLWTLTLSDKGKQILVTHSMGKAPKALAQLGDYAKSELDSMFGAD